MAKIDFSRAALFLDRDGVINQRLMDDYVKSKEEFVFIDGVKEAIAKASKIFKYIFVVSNQQGIGKGLMSMEDCSGIHSYMCQEVEKAGGRIDRVYVCPDLKAKKSIYRKPGVGMGLKAKKDFVNFAFSSSVMIGDTRGDMEFGKRLGMRTALVGRDKKALQTPLVVDEAHDTLKEAIDALEFEFKSSQTNRNNV